MEQQPITVVALTFLQQQTEVEPQLKGCTTIAWGASSAERKSVSTWIF